MQNVTAGGRGAGESSEWHSKRFDPQVAARARYSFRGKLLRKGLSKYEPIFHGENETGKMNGRFPIKSPDFPDPPRRLFLGALRAPFSPLFSRFATHTFGDPELQQKSIKLN